MTPPQYKDGCVMRLYSASWRANSILPGLWYCGVQGQDVLRGEDVLHFFPSISPRHTEVRE
ncbi:hypothetical protein E2C01_051730 [Portunus trituberculatus]|uniref:Uncharacterized protein n=1 Tax=Portunus trituberculatus TaxID=210409 RepID=A0A5B7GJV1_PORTR|nr:hypothetical protein [Portunus trituberculatus]